MTNILIQSLLQKGWREGTEIKKNAQDPNVIDKATKTNWEGEPTKQTKRGLNQALARLNNQPHRSQLGDKIIKNKGNSMGKAKDMGVINWRREKNKRETCPKNNTKLKNEQM